MVRTRGRDRHPERELDRQWNPFRRLPRAPARSSVTAASAGPWPLRCAPRRPPRARSPARRAAAPSVAAGGVVLLCVPDAEIAAAAAVLTRRDGVLVGHCSGATGLEVL